MKGSIANIGLRNAATPTWGRPVQSRHVPAVPVRQDPFPHPLAGEGLPGVAQEIADVLGQERALYLIGQLPRCFVGREGAKSWQVMLSVPTAARLRLSHPLVRILGLEDAQRMAEAFGGECLKPPTCAGVYRAFRDASIPVLISDGLSLEAVAEIVGTTAACVKRIAKNAARPQ